MEPQVAQAGVDESRAAEYCTGITLLHGLNGVRKDVRKARKLLHVAANRGHAGARGEMGWMLCVVHPVMRSLGPQCSS